MYRFNAIIIKPSNTFVDIDRIILKFIWNNKGTLIAKIFEKRRIKWEESVYLILKHHIGTVIKITSTGRGTDTQINRSK